MGRKCTLVRGILPQLMCMGICRCRSMKACICDHVWEKPVVRHKNIKKNFFNPFTDGNKNGYMTVCSVVT